jgi:cell division protein FtsB
MVLSAKTKKPGKSAKSPLFKKQSKKTKLKFRLNGPSVILLILLGFIFYSFGGQVVEMYNVQNEIKKIQGQMVELRTKNTDLGKQVDQLNSDAYIEREAREKLGLVKPGEKIILEAKSDGKGIIPPKAQKKPNSIEVH